MYNLNKISSLILFFLVFNLSTNAQQWTTVGGSSISAGAASHQQIEAIGDTIYVAYIDSVNGNKATVKMYDGTAWSTVGNAGFSPDPIRHIDLAINPHTKRPIIAAGVQSPSHSIAMEYDGTTWDTLGSDVFGGYEPSIIYNNHRNQVYLTAHQATYDPFSVSLSPTVFTYSNNKWDTLVALGSYLDYEAPNLIISMRPTSSIVNLSYLDGQSPDFGAVIGKYILYNNSVPSIVNFGGSVGIGAARYLAAADYYLAGSAYSSSDKIVVRRYNNSSTWSLTGGAPASSGEGRYTGLTYDYTNSILYVSYQDMAYSGKATVRKYEGTTWATLGSEGFSSGNALYTGVAAAGNYVYIVFQDEGNSNKTTVMRCDRNINIEKIQAISNSINIHPNPTNSVINIDTEKQIDHINVLSIDGALIKSTTSSQISVKELPQGIYVLEVFTDEGRGIKRFIKE